MNLSPDREPSLTPQTQAAGPQSAAARDVVAETRTDVDRAFATLYGRAGPAAFAAFAEAAGRDGVGTAAARLATHPETFGAVAAGQQGLAPRLAAALPVAAQIGSIPAGRAAGPEQTRDPSALRQALDFLYSLNESPGGSLAMAVGSFVPGLDQVLDVVDVGLNLDRVSQPAHRNDPEAWTNLGVTAVGAALPFAGDAVEAALKAALGPGGRRAAANAMETLAPILRRAGVNPAEFLDGLATRLPRLLDRGLDVASRRLGGALDRLAEPRVLIPNAVERAAAGAADSIRALARDARAPLARAGDEIRAALTNLADAARRSDAPAPRAARGAPDAPTPRAQAGGPTPEPPRRPVTPEIAARRDLARDFYRREGLEADRAASEIDAIDFSRPVRVQRLEAGSLVEQHTFPGGQGSYYTPVGTDPNTLGISTSVLDEASGRIVPRERVLFRVTQDTDVLRSTAADGVVDRWSIRGQDIRTHGGGTQLFSRQPLNFRRVSR